MYGQTTVQAVMEDYRNCIPSWLRYHEEYQPDMYWAPGSILPKRPLETLDCQYARWPGRHLSENASFQILNHEFMAAEEYVEKYDQKLDWLADVPKGKVLYHLAGGDLKRIKQKLGGIACVSGGVDGILLEHGTQEQVERNVREVLDICMQDGGYFLDTTVPLDLAKPENLRALFETARKYGQY